MVKKEDEGEAVGEEKNLQEASTSVVEDKPVEKEQYLNELKFWMCVCLTLEDWTAIHNKYSGKADLVTKLTS